MERIFAHRKFHKYFGNRSYLTSEDASFPLINIIYSNHSNISNKTSVYEIAMRRSAVKINRSNGLWSIVPAEYLIGSKIARRAGLCLTIQPMWQRICKTRTDHLARLTSTNDSLFPPQIVIYFIVITRSLLPFPGERVYHSLTLLALRGWNWYLEKQWRWKDHYKALAPFDSQFLRYVTD